MANPFGDEETLEDEEKVRNETQLVSGEGDLIIEGFLCPNCIEEFNTIDQLSLHFENHHKGEIPQKTTSSLREIFGKAKKIFESENDTPNNISPGGKQNSPQIDLQFDGVDVDEYYRVNQVMGPTKSHWPLFKEKRDARIEKFINESNKLLIRLDKLLREAPQDSKDFKLHEKNIVKWVDDELVNLCCQCGKGFNISRRKHHCRLCGCIMCHNCSQFLEPNYANQLVSPIDLETSQLSSEYLTNFGKLQRRASITSLPAISTLTSDTLVRVCKYCKDLLDIRNQQMWDRHSKPPLCQIYNRYRESVVQAEELVKLYYTINNSLRTGEASNFKVEHAHGHEVKAKIMVLAEEIDVLSRKISAIGSKDNSVKSLQKRLQNRIRASAVNFIHNCLSGLPPIPSVDELKKIQANNSFKAISPSKIQPMYISKRVSNTPKSNHSSAATTLDDGWTPETSSLFKENIDTMDPMLLQINQIKEFIRKAKEANKYDEANMLEANLTELHIEYMMQSIPPGDDKTQNLSSSFQFKN